jgi:hypothetical protein
MTRSPLLIQFLPACAPQQIAEDGGIDLKKIAPKARVY